MIDWNIKNGLVKPAEVKKHLDQLKDLEANTVEVTLEDDETGSFGEPDEFN